jgi:MFS family permease
LYAAIGAVLPFLSIYLKFLGMRAHQIGAIIGVRPLVSAIVCPVWGWIADKYRCRKSLALLSILGWILFITFLFMCPLLADVYQASGWNHSSHVTNKTNFSDVIDNGITSRMAPFFKRHHTHGHWHWNAHDKKNKDKLKKIKDALNHKTINEKHHSLPHQQKGPSPTNDVKESVTKWPPNVAAMTTEKSKVNQSMDESIVTNQERRFVFIILLIGFGAMQILLAPVFPIADAVALQSLGPDTSQWGLQRMMGSFGYGIR